jgi:hypothetical protein
MATILSHFSGEANRARCLAHIVNLVAKIILRQFDKSKKKKKKTVDDTVNDANMMQDGENEDPDDHDEEQERVLDKEEKEMDEGDDEDDEDAAHLARDLEIIEEAMEAEIEMAANKVKPVRQVLYKVNLCLRWRQPSSFFLFFFFWLSALSSTVAPCQCSFFNTLFRYLLLPFTVSFLLFLLTAFFCYLPPCFLCC